MCIVHFINYSFYEPSEVFMKQLTNEWITNKLCEDLLSSWLALSASVRNERLVRSLTFQEVFICNILSHAQTDGTEEITASVIVERTGILKSQVNKILDTMERKQLIERLRSPHDKRYVLIRLTVSGQTQYQKEHKHILGIMEQLILQLGSDETKRLIPELSHIAAIMKEMKEE